MKQNDYILEITILKFLRSLKNGVFVSFDGRPMSILQAHVLITGHKREILLLYRIKAVEKR